MGLRKRPGSEHWYYRFRIAGQEYSASTGQTDKREAAKVERRARAAIEAKGPRQRIKQGVGLAEVGVLDIERAIAAKCVRGEIEALKTRWRNVCSVLGHATHPKRIGLVEIEHLAHELGKTLRGQTVRRHLSALKRGLQLAKRRGFIHDVPDTWPSVKSDEPKAEQAGKWHEPAVIAAWLRELTPDARDEATLILLTGLRATEAKRINSTYVHLAPPDTGCEHILRLTSSVSKTRKPRVIPLPPAAYEVIMRRSGSNSDGCMFPHSHTGTYRAACVRIGYNARITLRDLRHMYASLADWLGKDRRSAQEILGHTSESMTARYLHSTAERLGAVAAQVGAWSSDNVLQPQLLQAGTVARVQVGK